MTEHGIELHPNDVRNLSELTLPVSTVSADVTVTAADTDIATSGERSSLITANDIKKLSTVGRDVTELIKTQAGFSVLQSGIDNGASTDPAVVGSGSGLGNYVGNGATANGTSITSDGANVTDPGNGSGQTQTVNMDMVQEVKIETSNFGADTAKGPTVITAVGKSGGSEYHGSVYLHGRTSHLNAEDWYAKYRLPLFLQYRTATCTPVSTLVALSRFPAPTSTPIGKSHSLPGLKTTFNAMSTRMARR